MADNFDLTGVTPAVAAPQASAATTQTNESFDLTGVQHPAPTTAAQGAARTVAEMSPAERFAAGVGHGVTRIQEGAEQIALQHPEVAKTILRAASPFVPAAAAWADALDLVAEKDQQAGTPGHTEQLLQQLIDNEKEASAPLLDTGVAPKQADESTVGHIGKEIVGTLTHAGSLGNAVGEGLTVAPVAAIPGANTLVGATLLGGATGALQPVATGESRLENTESGALGGLFGQAAGNFVSNTVGRGISSAISNATTRQATRQAANTGVDAAINEAQQAGYVLTPSITGGSTVGNIAESYAGKAKLQQEASIMNQANTNNLVRGDLGIRPGVAITPELLQRIRNVAGQAYEGLRNWPSMIYTTPQFRNVIQNLGDVTEAMRRSYPGLAEDMSQSNVIQQLSQGLDQFAHDPAGLLDMSRKLRSDATVNMKNGKDVETYTLGAAQRRAANALEDMMEQEISSAGNPQVTQRFRIARQLIAKTHDIEYALNDTTGDVSARKLAMLYHRGQPLTGGLERAARFAQTAQKLTQDPTIIGAHPLYNPVELMAAGASGVNALMGGHPLAAAGMLTGILGRPAVREGLLTPRGQAAFAQPPTYDISAMMRGANAIVNSGVLQGGKGLGAVAGATDQNQQQ